jgi:hypothetical protein
MRRVAEALATTPGPVRSRLQAAEPHFRHVAETDWQNDAERHLNLRIGAGLVEAANDDDPDDERLIGKWIGELDERRAAEIASDLWRLYELVARLREPRDEYPRSRT